MNQERDDLVATYLGLQGFEVVAVVHARHHAGERSDAPADPHHPHPVPGHVWRAGVFAIMGSSVTGKPLVGRPSANNRYQATMFPLCVDTGKDSVMSRLQIPSPGPGFVHLPDWVEDEYLAQLTAEKAVRKYVKGRGGSGTINGLPGSFNVTVTDGGKRGRNDRFSIAISDGATEVGNLCGGDIQIREKCGGGDGDGKDDDKDHGNGHGKGHGKGDGKGHDKDHDGGHGGGGGDDDDGDD